MKKALLVAAACVLMGVAGLAGAQEDVTAPIHQFIDGFNKGDVKSAYAAYAEGNILIVDEFAPHRWYGPHAAQEWAASYDKHATATGVTDSMVRYGSPTRTEIGDDVAYVVIPTTYLYKEHGKPMTEQGQMTFVLHKEAVGWKISSWVWTGSKPNVVQ